MLEHRGRDGFGYAAQVPPDCDSTAWFCRLAESLDECASPAYRAAARFLQSSVRSNGGVPTYPASEQIRTFTGLDEAISFQGWTSTHTCVTAAAAGLRALKSFPRTRAFLESTRMPDGGWWGYWWPSRAYVTMLAAEALGVSARAWACSACETGAFDLACRTALGAPLQEELVALQLPDGSWPASAALRIPEPQVLDPHKGPFRVSLDRNRIYTTATVIRVLHESF